MHIRLIGATLVLAGLSFVQLPAATPLMPISEVKPGMVGIGKTVFEGVKLEEFKVHIIGVLKNVIGPSRDLIVAKLEGGPLATTGVIAGMSGSPVYIDGKLVGAVAYSLGQFSKEPIAGITPIAEMTEVATLPQPRLRAARARLEVPITQEGINQSLRQAFSWMRPFAGRPDDVQILSGGGGVTALDPRLGTFLRPIATPLVATGFSAEGLEWIGTAFRDHGFLPMAGGGIGDNAAPDTNAPLGPGDPVGIELISGDLSIGATGTITHVDGDRVYAFGHPFYNLGPTQFPMTRAYVHTLLPSLLSSMKISSTGAVIGTIQQDRSTAVAGMLGPGPAMIPISMTLDSGRGLKKNFSVKVVNDQLFTPLLTYMTVLNTLASYERQFGAATYTVKGTASVKKHGEVAFEDIFTGDAALTAASAYVAAPITFLLGNDFEPVEISGLNITITSSEEPRTATLERVWLDSTRPRPGRTVPLKMLLRTYRGEEIIKTLPIDIPAHAKGSLSVMVTDGARLSQTEQRELRQASQPQGVTQMVRALNNARKNNRLYVRLLSSDAGAVVNGEYMSSLPPSVLAVLEGDRNSGSFTPLRNATLGEWELPTDFAVIGSRLLTINVDQN
jgi:SpoIVB peptidase S55